MPETRDEMMIDEEIGALTRGNPESSVITATRATERRWWPEPIQFTSPDIPSRPRNESKNYIIHLKEGGRKTIAASSYNLMKGWFHFTGPDYKMTALFRADDVDFIVEQKAQR